MRFDCFIIFLNFTCFYSSPLFIINFDKKKGKRKKDGVFYTPEYITKYIVNEAVGSWLEDIDIEV